MPNCGYIQDESDLINQVSKQISKDSALNIAKEYINVNSKIDNLTFKSQNVTDIQLYFDTNKQLVWDVSVDLDYSIPTGEKMSIAKGIIINAVDGQVSKVE